MTDQPNNSPVDTLELQEIAHSVRSFLEPLWMDLHVTLTDRIQIPVSSGMCRYTCEFLLRNANALHLQGWKICGGDTGWTDDSDIHIHFHLSNGSLILDLTADQFNGTSERVLITTIDDPRYTNQDPITSTSLIAERYIDRTLWWDQKWQNQRKADIQDDQEGRAGGNFTLANLRRFLGRDAAAFALVLAQSADLAVFRSQSELFSTLLAGQEEGKILYDAAGPIPDRDAAGMIRLSDPEIENIRSGLDQQVLNDAALFASSHTHLSDLTRFAFYARMEEEICR